MVSKQPAPGESLTNAAGRKYGMSKNRPAMAFLIIVLLGVGACSPFAPAPRPAAYDPLPQTYALYPVEATDPSPWWYALKSDELNRLLIRAFAGNLTLQQAWARMEQARALAVQAGADLYPDLNVTGGTTHSRQHRENGTSDTYTTRLYAIGLSSQYEIDLWGRLRAEENAATLTAEAAREDWNTTAIALAANVATAWVQILSQQNQKRLLAKQLETNLTYLELVDLRYRKGIVTGLDVFQQQQIVEGVQSQIPLVEAREQLLHNQLAVLLGQAPGRRLDIRTTDLPVPTQVPAAGLPADLLSNRPDVRAAGRRLEATDWQLAAARANRLPAVSLTATAGYGPADIDLMLDNWIMSLASNLTAPLLDGGRRAAEVDRARAATDENLAAYRETVLTAVREVEDALMAEYYQRRHIAALDRQLEAARNALVEARELYRKGVDDYLPVLTQLLAVQNLERDLITQNTQLFVDRIDLYTALGGDWPDTVVVGK
jgi:NodT family efflux transporter outer membrane factor (OMF) lipoprotein